MENYYNISNYHLITNRRLQKEVIALYQYENNIYSQFIKNINPKFDNDDISISVIESNKLSFTLFYKTKYAIQITMNIPSEYPFRPPICKLNRNNDYLGQLIKMNNHVYNFKVHSGDNNQCFCCKSLTCRNNWGPKNNLVDMLNEIYDMFELINNKVEKIFIKKIKNKNIMSKILKEKLGYDII
tara:strand:- start:91 stop:642 length:552 start_codon:yes stop_codon:yes gene_type:complete